VESITITCTTCYITGKATAQLTINGNFNASQAFLNIVNETRANFDNITTSAIAYVEHELEAAAKNATSLNFNFNDLSPPTLSNVSFDMHIPGVPQVLLQLQFDGMELYVQLDTVLAVESTYTVNLFTPETPIGLTIPDVKFGVWFSLDLILDAKAYVDISSGFHIKLDDGVKYDIAMFATDASEMDM
jgi:hypothetical protein